MFSTLIDFILSLSVSVSRSFVIVKKKKYIIKIPYQSLTENDKESFLHQLRLAERQGAVKGLIDRPESSAQIPGHRMTRIHYDLSIGP